MCFKLYLSISSNLCLGQMAIFWLLMLSLAPCLGTGVQHKTRDCSEVQDAGHNDQGMENLMVSEGLGRWVWPLQGIHRKKRVKKVYAVRRHDRSFCLKRQPRIAALKAATSALQMQNLRSTWEALLMQQKFCQRQSRAQAVTAYSVCMLRNAKAVAD